MRKKSFRKRKIKWNKPLIKSVAKILIVGQTGCLSTPGIGCEPASSA